MARFASIHQNQRHTVRNQQAEQRIFDDNGLPIIVPGKRELEAHFRRSLVTEKDILEVKSRLRFTGTLMDVAGRDVDPAYRVSVFDSELAKLQNGWTDEEEQIVVEGLRKSSENGRSYIEVEPIRVAKPWPGYDEVESAERIVELARDIGADFDSVIAYELENRASPTVLTALREAKAEEGEVVIVSA